MKNKTITKVIRVDNETKKLMADFYKDMKRDKTPPYAIFQADTGDTIVTLYESGKAMFQGVSADIEAGMWESIGKDKENIDYFIDREEVKEKKEKTTIPIDISSVGSDEVGTGDYFGPIVVCATYVSTDKQALLQDLKVMDSKKITDDKIKKIAPIIMKEIPYQAYILTNKEYNTLNHDEVNMNKIKAILHNKVLTSLKNKNYPYDLIVVDQFTTPKSYYNYLINVPNKVTDITFTPKAEDQCLSVACASIISRYIFLQEMYKMSKELNQEVPKGAGPSVIEFTQKLVKEQGIDILNNYVKLNFQTTNKIKE